MIDFINPKSVQIASEKIEKAVKLKKALQLCLNGRVCPVCTEDLEVIIDDNRNSTYHCTSKLCRFTWPEPKKRFMFRTCEDKNT